MIIYLDSCIVRYILRYHHYLCQQTGQCPVSEPKLAREIRALRKFNEYDQYAFWEFAWSPRLERELIDGSRSITQRETFRDLRGAWKSSHLFDDEFTSRANRIERSLFWLRLDDGDRRHLAEAIALDADCFLTNDEAMIEECTKAELPLLVSKVSECVRAISESLHLDEEKASSKIISFRLQTSVRVSVPMSC
jgi:hypothetical protein